MQGINTAVVGPLLKIILIVKLIDCMFGANGIVEFLAENIHRCTAPSVIGNCYYLKLWPVIHYLVHHPTRVRAKCTAAAVAFEDRVWTRHSSIRYRKYSGIRSNWKR